MADNPVVAGPNEESAGNEPRPFEPHNPDIAYMPTSLQHSLALLVSLQGWGRFVARPASQALLELAGRTNPKGLIGHWRLCTDFPSLAAAHHKRTAGQ